MFSIEVRSLKEAQTKLPQEPHAVISIYNSNERYPELPENKNTIGILRLKFDDVDTEEQLRSLEVQASRPFIMFSEEQAQEILNFALYHYKMIKHLIVHCTMGVSRSPGVAAALTNFFGGDDSHFFRRKSPNRHVYRTILEVASLYSSPD